MWFKPSPLPKETRLNGHEWDYGFQKLKIHEPAPVLLYDNISKFMTIMKESKGLFGQTRR